MCVWVFPLGLTFSSSLSLEFCVSQSLFDFNKLPQNEIRLSSQLCRAKLLRPVLGACGKNDFVVKAGCECRRRLIHYLKITLDPGWPTTTLLTGSSARSRMSLLIASTAQQPGFLGDPRSPPGGEHDSSSGPQLL